MPGVLIQDVLVECLQILDSERIKAWKDGWPEGMSLAAHEGTHIRFAQGLYYDYHRLDQVIQNLPGPVKVDRAVHFKVGQHPTGFKEAAACFPGRPTWANASSRSPRSTSATQACSTPSVASTPPPAC
jgi:hypothetical protein